MSEKTDKELADALVALGIVGKEHPESGFYWFKREVLFADNVVRDWRVAGAVMERCVVIHLEDFEDGTYNAIANAGGEIGKAVQVHGNHPARAIIEAGVAALGAK